MTEFYLNSPPTADTTQIKVIGEPGNGTTMSSIYFLNMTNYIDDRDDTNILYQVYVLDNQDYYQVTDPLASNMFYFKLPLYSNSVAKTNL